MASSEEKQRRPFDVIIFGASGFTGKYVVREALKFLGTTTVGSSSGGNPRENTTFKNLALAGRSPSKISQALAWASHPAPAPPLPIISADVSDPSSLLSLCRQTRLLLACVGPFRLYGEPVVAACVETGTDYLDITGEPEFMERMEAKYHKRAAETGALVVSACGFDSVPAEMGVLFNARQWTGPAVPNRIVAYLNLESERRIVGNLGTYESAILGVANAGRLQELRRSMPARQRPKIVGPPPPKEPFVEKQKELGLWAMKLPSADAIVVRRTFATLTENPSGLQGVNESEEEAVKRQKFWSGIKPAHFGVKFGTKSILSILGVIYTGIFIGLLGTTALGRSLLLRFPGVFTLGIFRKTGPTEEEVASASFKMWFVGQGYSDGALALETGAKPDQEIVTRIAGPEIGYLTTPIVLLQCALVVVGQRVSLPKGGVYTPGVVFGPSDLQQRLQDNGISFDVISRKSTRYSGNLAYISYLVEHP